METIPDIAASLIEHLKKYEPVEYLRIPIEQLKDFLQRIEKPEWINIININGLKITVEIDLARMKLDYLKALGYAIEIEENHLSIKIPRYLYEYIQKRSKEAIL
jgi:hypothetical protein